VSSSESELAQQYDEEKVFNYDQIETVVDEHVVKECREV